jgi:hypothetical protein
MKKRKKNEVNTIENDDFLAQEAQEAKKPPKIIHLIFRMMKFGLIKLRDCKNRTLTNLLKMPP